MYHRYGKLWQTFLRLLGCNVVLSGASTQQMLSKGAALSDNECCLPVKMFIGHAAHLASGCDYILAPRFERLSGSEEFCVRFWGLPDIVRNTFPGTRVLSYNLCDGRDELSAFLCLGKRLGADRAQALYAYRTAKRAQHAANITERNRQRALLRKPGLKVLIAAQPYIFHDPLISGPLLHALGEQNATSIFPCACPPALCRQKSKQLTHSLYWTMNKEVVGAISLLRPHVDGVILLSAFPCGTDSLVNELILRRVKDIPITQIILDGLQGEAGLQTRIECFLDIVKEGRSGNAC